MFLLKKDNRFDWPVDVCVPLGDGKHSTHRFTATFDLIPADKMSEYIKLSATDGDGAISLDCLVGWDGVSDENEKPISFNDETRRELLAIPYVRRAVVMAYFAAMNGKAPA